MILPELGGRIQRAYDKTNDYDFVYYNRVIKPALVGLTGPWISGGMMYYYDQPADMILYQGLGFTKEAAEYFNKVLESDPNHQNAARYLRLLQ